MKKFKNIPKIRFNGFSDEWEEKELSSLAQIYDGTHQTPHYTDSGVMFLSVENIETLKSDKFISEKDFRSNFKVFPEFGDVLMTRIGDIGTANVIKNQSLLAYYVSLALIKPFNINSYFLKNVISSKAFQAELNNRSLNTAIPKKINMGEIGKVSFFSPTLAEQQKIGALFQNLDERLEIEKQKYTKLINYKKAMLECMFPKNGEKFPKLRFNGFSGEWEKNIIKNHLSYEQPSDYIVKSEKYKTSGIPVLTANKAFILGYTDEKNIYDKGKCIIFDDFTMDFKYVNFPFMVKSSAMKILTSNNENLYFIYCLLQNKKLEPESHQRHYISLVQHLNVLMPKFKEQQKIGSFFQNLDEKIELSKNKIKKIESFKKSLLEKMFV